MKKLLLALFLTVNFFQLSAQPLSSATKDFEYSFVSREGTNASAVVWHPKKKLYFTLIAGNSDFPLEAFDENGKSKYSREIGVDSRGLFTNGKDLFINAYDEMGWYKVSFNDNLSSHSTESLFQGQLQPDPHSAGVYYKKKKSVAFYDYSLGAIRLYSLKNPERVATITLILPLGNEEDFNLTSMGVTGKKGYDFVLLNTRENSLYFFDHRGMNTAKTKLPKDAVTHPMFRFSYTNGRVFLYDVSKRKWTAYKVMK